MQGLFKRILQRKNRNLAHFLFLVLIILFSSIVYAQQYNKALTRSIADSIYCLRNKNCTLGNLVVSGNLNVSKNIYVGGCIIYNASGTSQTLGTCV